MALPVHVHRCLCFLTEIIFLAGLLCLLRYFLAPGSQGAAERAWGLVIGMAFVLPVPLFLVLYLELRRHSHGTRQFAPESLVGSSGGLWPTARRGRRCAERSRSSGPDALPEEPGAGALPQWWAELPPTYDEAMSMPRLEEPRVHHQSGRGHVLQV